MFLIHLIQSTNICLYSRLSIITFFLDIYLLLLLLASTTHAFTFQDELPTPRLPLPIPQPPFLTKRANEREVRQETVQTVLDLPKQVNPVLGDIARGSTKFSLNMFKVSVSFSFLNNFLNVQLISEFDRDDSCK